MFVLIDLEWIKDANGGYEPTQLAAVKVNAAWNIVDWSAERMRPRSRSCNWEHVAYTGGDQEAFLLAKSAHSVLQAFVNWLSEEDVLVFWHENVRIALAKLLYKILKLTLANRTVVLHSHTPLFLDETMAALGGLYEIAAAEGIDTKPTFQHCAVNDVLVIQKLMKKLAVSQSALLASAYALQRENGWIYRYDPKTNKVHKRDCAKLHNDTAMYQGFNSLKKAVKRGYAYCDCVKQEYLALLKVRNTNIVQKSEYRYVYGAEGKVFHNPTCKAAWMIKALEGSVTYEKACSAGRRPCKICCPVPTQSCINKYDKKLDHPRYNPADWGSEEIGKALRRQRTAAEERSRRLGDASLTWQQCRDIATLTQPTLAFWSGRGYATFHLRSCAALQGLHDLRGFGAYKDALKAGYRPCRICKPTARNDVKLSIPIADRMREGERVEDLVVACDHAGYAYHQEGAYFYLKTPVGKWRINTSKTPVTLGHINLVVNPNAKDYHRQPRICLSFADAFRYICRHDASLEKRLPEGHILASS